MQSEPSFSFSNCLGSTDNLVIASPASNENMQHVLSIDFLHSLAADIDVDAVRSQFSSVEVHDPYMPPSITPASACIQGAREANEDCAGSAVLASYAFSVVCDGHGGTAVATTLGTSFIAALRLQLESTPGNAPAEQLLAILQDAYTIAIVDVDRYSEVVGFGRVDCGSTITAVMLQRATMVCATLQLGDCRAGVCNGRTGAILQGEQLCSSEQHPESTNICVSREHNFQDIHEQNRIAEAVSDQGWKLSATQRCDVMEGEDRYLGKLTTQGHADFNFNEPARGVENTQMYPLALVTTLAAVQRVPELVAWQLPEQLPTDHLVLFCACDGFFSHKAFPSVDAFGRCLANPEAYMAGDCLQGTCLQQILVNPDYRRYLYQAKKWLPREDNVEWNQDPTKCCYELMLNLAPDSTWENAVNSSWTNVERLRAMHGGLVPSLVEAPAAAIEMITNLAVLLMSDDNVSIEALVIAPPESSVAPPETSVATRA